MTQCERVVKYMEDFGSITSMEAVNDLGIMRLASRICDLSKQGYQIERTTESGRNRYGETTSYTRYSLRKEETDV